MLQDDRVMCDVLADVRSVCESVCDLSIDFASYWVYSPLVIQKINININMLTTPFIKTKNSGSQGCGVRVDQSR